MNNKLVLTYSSSNLNPSQKKGSNPYKLAKVQIRTQLGFQNIIKLPNEW